MICRLKMQTIFKESFLLNLYFRNKQTLISTNIIGSSLHHTMKYQFNKRRVTFGCFHVTALVCWQYQIRVYIILLRSGSHFDKRKVSKINKYWKFKSVMVTYPARNPYHVCIMVNIAPQCFYVSIYVSEYWI